jgi:cephalosporin hydroxylase
MRQDADFQQMSQDWLARSFEHRYGYNFTWMGQPIIKYPQDLVALQEILHQVRPEVVVETGLAYGGSALFLASVLAVVRPEGRVVSVEQRVLPEVRDALDASPLGGRIEVIEGDSVAPSTLEQVRARIPDGASCLVTLDSGHTAAHVLEELRRYSSFVSPGSYLVVFDTFIEGLPPIEGKPYGPQNSPMTAVASFLEECDEFEVDASIEERIMISEAPSGYLRRKDAPGA